jgi:hypothetical protein
MKVCWAASEQGLLAGLLVRQKIFRVGEWSTDWASNDGRGSEATPRGEGKPNDLVTAVRSGQVGAAQGRDTQWVLLPTTAQDVDDGQDLRRWHWCDRRSGLGQGGRP